MTALSPERLCSSGTCCPSQQRCLTILYTVHQGFCYGTDRLHFLLARMLILLICLGGLVGREGSLVENGQVLDLLRFKFDFAICFAFAICLRG